MSNQTLKDNRSLHKNKSIKSLLKQLSVSRLGHPETTNPNFVSRLKEAKLDTLQLVNVIYRLTENTQAQAKAATILHQQLKYIVDRGLQEEDLPIFEESIEQARRLAVYGYGTARQQEQEAREFTTKAFKLPNSLEHLETPSMGEKRHAFDDQFISQYYEELYKEEQLNFNSS
ncbi:hypothetical protein G6F57_006343 [Rhizopus arrhizus]|uniref:Uncharacterized protein n=1 Tax=Rhizopus oryzae TaxID=64495 RepID=A0A9P6XH20_RHIOR|nr:hypothetical protein G6F23_005021 [Rhizopus arrhizus]KAG1417659.1 hypothetical protein G6F58_005406 [Rhizopus delemar]KAG0939238.1 hypothetical protein G6F30_007361 [Rhizopus arrhizus]KAG0951856.1 hypothetical protein G6F32_004743 [Rhizopus arrhizus]KAG0985032.1 hypothetical protein G6F29_004336 [Rhizopus arrhizus]